MFKILSSLTLAGALLAGGCQSTPQNMRTYIPKTSEDVINIAEASIPGITQALGLACNRFPKDSEKRNKCRQDVYNVHKVAEDIMVVVRQWLPVLVDAIQNGNKLKEMEAREILNLALENVPEPYQPLVELGKRLPLLRRDKRRRLRIS